MYYEDLTPYEYSIRRPDPRRTEYVDGEFIKAFGLRMDDLNLLNVGWLEGYHPFVVGEMSETEVDQIATLCLAPKLLMRGFQICYICYIKNRGQEQENTSMLKQTYKSHNIWLGNGEIWIKGKSNTVYIAPTLVLHYILEHNYQLPMEARVALREQFEGIETG